METNDDPEKTQLAPTEPFVTPPTELALENQPTVQIRMAGPTMGPTPAPDIHRLVEEVGHLAEQVGQAAYQVDWLQRNASPQQGQLEQEAKQASEMAQQPGALGVAGGGILFSVNATVSLSKDVLMWVVLFILLLLAVWALDRYVFKRAPALA